MAGANASAGKSSQGGGTLAGGAGGAAPEAGSGSPSEGGAAGGVPENAAGMGGANGSPSEGGAAGRLGDAGAAGAGGATPDPSSCTAPGPAEVGGVCVANSACDRSPGSGDGLCSAATLGFADWPSEGYCIRSLDCPGSCEALACGEGETCVDLDGCKACLPACCNGDACPSGQICANAVGTHSLGGLACVPGNPTAGVGSACEDISGCYPGLSCLINDEHPGGECTKAACTLGDDTTCPGEGHCIADPISTHCAQSCQDVGDCRGALGYDCVDLGGVSGKVCRHPMVGDACASDGDCGGGAWHCQTGASFPGGYCTLTGCAVPGSSSGCPLPTTVCFDPAVGNNYCVGRCPSVGTQSTCRLGYSCQDANPGIAVLGGCAPP